MPSHSNPVPIADALRAAIRDSNLSYNELARLAKADQGTISRFMLGQRDVTVAVAGRMCLVLGYGLTRVGPALAEPLANPPKSNRNRPKSRRPPASVVRRGQGRRVDLEGQKPIATDLAPLATDATDSPGRGGKRRPAESVGGPLGKVTRRKK